MYDRRSILWASGGVLSDMQHHYAIHGETVLAEILPPTPNEPDGHYHVISFGDDPRLGALYDEFNAGRDADEERSVPYYPTLAEAKAAVMDALCGTDVASNA
jgi:hypothetical protein